MEDLIELPTVKAPEEVADSTGLHVIHQPCRNCVFAVYEGKTQTSCSQGRLDKFRAQDANAVISAQDEELEFEIVNGRPCILFRDRYSDWARAFPPEAYAAQARKEVVIRTDAVVVVSGKSLNAGCLLADLKKTLCSLKSQVLHPSNVYVITNQDAVPVPKLHAHLVKHGKGLNWNLTNILVRTKTGDRIDPLACVDEAFSKFRGHFYTVLAPGFSVPNTFFLDIDRTINDTLSRFAVLEPVDGWNCLTVQNGFHNAFDGNQPGYGQDVREKDEENADRVVLKNVLEKARFFSQVYEKPGLVQKAIDVCNKLRT